jgi:flagellar basal body-associated protein FliL
MPSDLESVPFTPAPEPSEGKSRWVKVGLVALTSALAGGLAAAWWYRKTLASLQEAEEADDNPHFRILDE